MIKPLAAVLFASLLASNAASDPVVGQKGKQFSVSQLSVRVGTGVVFRNDDDVTHNVFSTSEVQRFNLRTQPPGESSRVVFERAGTLEIRCAFHPTMKLTITVSP